MNDRLIAMRDRQRLFLKRVAERPREPPAPVWYANVGFLSCLAVGDRAKADSLMREKLEMCLSFRSDCADFLLNLLFRALFLFPDRIDPGVKALIRQAAVSARYYGGHTARYPMFYSSENHHMSWATAEYLAAQQYPDDDFTFDGRPARAHFERARFLVANWIDRRARWGYCEWNSAPYMGVNLMSLLNLADFSADPEIRMLASLAVTRLLADLAADSAGGGVWGAQARVYEPHVFSPYTQPAATALMILLGAGDASRLNDPTEGVGEVVATTAYQPPEWLCRLADAGGGPQVNEERHLVEGDMLYMCRSAFWRAPLEITNEEARRKFAPDSLIEIPLRTERTPDHLVSAVLLPRGHNMSKVDAQALYWMSCLNGRVPIFTTQPPVPADARAQGQYWAGTAGVPRCGLKDGILAAVYAGGKHAQDMTHAHFPTPDLDAWERRGGWFLGRSGDAYAGLLAPEGSALTADGRWAGREIKAPGGKAVWVAAFGSKSHDGGFSSFADRCGRDIRVTVAEDRSAVEVAAPDTQLRVSYAEGVTVGGEAFSCAGWPQMNNAVVQAGFGDAITTVTPSGESGIRLDFSAARRIAAEWERAD